MSMKQCTIFPAYYTNTHWAINMIDDKNMKVAIKVRGIYHVYIENIWVVSLMTGPKMEDLVNGGDLKHKDDCIPGDGEQVSDYHA